MGYSIQTDPPKLSDITWVTPPPVQPIPTSVPQTQTLPGVSPTANIAYPAAPSTSVPRGSQGARSTDPFSYTGRYEFPAVQEWGAPLVGSIPSMIGGLTQEINDHIGQHVGSDIRIPPFAEMKTGVPNPLGRLAETLSQAKTYVLDPAKDGVESLSLGDLADAAAGVLGDLPLEELATVAQRFGQELPQMAQDLVTLAEDASGLVKGLGIASAFTEITDMATGIVPEVIQQGFDVVTSVAGDVIGVVDTAVSYVEAGLQTITGELPSELLEIPTAVVDGLGDVLEQGGSLVTEVSGVFSSVSREIRPFVEQMADLDIPAVVSDIGEVISQEIPREILTSIDTAAQEYLGFTESIISDTIVDNRTLQTIYNTTLGVALEANLPDTVQTLLTHARAEGSDRVTDLLKDAVVKHGVQGHVAMVDTIIDGLGSANLPVSIDTIFKTLIASPNTQTDDLARIEARLTAMGRTMEDLYKTEDRIDGDPILAIPPAATQAVRTPEAVAKYPDSLQFFMSPTRTVSDHEIQWNDTDLKTP